MPCPCIQRRVLIIGVAWPGASRSKGLKGYVEPCSMKQPMKLAKLLVMSCIGYCCCSGVGVILWTIKWKQLNGLFLRWMLVLQDEEGLEGQHIGAKAAAGKHNR